MRTVGNLALRKDDAGRVDVAATMDRVGAMLEAGVTDFSLQLAPPNDLDDAVVYMEPIVAGFREAAGRG